MAEGSRWSSSRAAQAKIDQQSSQRSGSQQSRWATHGSSNNGGSASSSSWRSRPNEATTSASNSSAFSRAQEPRSNTARPNHGSGASRWATPPSRPAASDDASVSALADTLSKTSIRSTAPPIHLQSSAHTPYPQPSSSTVSSRSDGLHVRSTSRPLGGKSLDRLALLASPSRGLDSTASLSTSLSSQGSMDLTSPDVQDEFRQYISSRLSKAIPLLSRAAVSVLSSTRYLPSPAKMAVSAGEDELQQILLLVRKLREALVASKRMDGFAVEVYELSAYLAVLCGDATQLAATLPRLVLKLYPSTPGEGGSEDVTKLATHLDLEHTTEERRMRIASLYMLQTLCLSGRATRLGQYTSESSSPLEPLHRGLREYRSLRSTLAGLYGSELNSHLSMCDGLYEALREVDPFSFSRLVTGKEEYQLDGWQRLVLLQTVPTLRSAAWAVARKSYMYLPISARVKGMIEGNGMQREGGSERFMAELLLLNTDLLPVAIDEAKQTQTEKTREEDPPEEWDADDASDATHRHADSKDDLEEDTRLHAFLALQFGTTLPSRLMPIKEGHAIKIR